MNYNSFLISQLGQGGRKLDPIWKKYNTREEWDPISKVRKIFATCTICNKNVSPKAERLREHYRKCTGFFPSRVPRDPLHASASSSIMLSDSVSMEPIGHMVVLPSTQPPPIKLEQISCVPDLGQERLGSGSEGSNSGPSTSFAPGHSVMEGEEGMVVTPVTPHDPLMDPSDQDDLDETDVKPTIFEETLEDDVNSNSQSLSAEQSPGGGMSGFYLLKKDTHCTTILDQLLHDETYADVTLTAQGGSIKAHRIVLSLASGYFRDVLSKDSAVKNVIFFKDLKLPELKNVINFVYTGEATVDASELESFMNIAEMLEISSLCDGHKNLPKQFISQKKENQEATNSTSSKANKRAAASSSRGSSSPPPKSRKVTPASETPKTNTSPIEETTVIKTEPEAYDGLLDLEYDESIPGTSKGTKEKKFQEGYSPEDPLPGRCPYCPPSTPFHMGGEEMTVHLQTNHPSKPFITCHHCSRVFILKSHYKKHQETCKPT